MLSALFSPLGPEQPVSGSAAVEEGTSMVNGAPIINNTANPLGIPNISTAFDMIVFILGPKGKVFPPELRSNACSLLSSVGRKDPEIILDADKTTMLAAMEAAAKPVVVALATELVTGWDTPISPVSTSTTGSTSPARNPQLVRNAAMRTLSVWGA